MPATHVQGTRRSRCLAAGVAVAASLSLASAAAADTTTIAPTGSGITAPSGVVRDTGGGLWISDALRGVCKVDPALPGGDALVTDGTWCISAANAAAGVAGAGPAAAFQMGYDAATSTLFVAEGSSHSSGVWRFHIDPATSTISSGTKIVFEADRVFGLALGTDTNGNVAVDYTTKRSPLIHRVPDAVNCSPCSPIIAGSAQSEGAPSLAELDGKLYIAEPIGVVTRLDNPGPTGGVAQPIVGFPGGLPMALAADPARGRVYAGTANGNNQDQVDVLSPSNGAIETYTGGLTGVTSLGVAPDGTLLIGDDPALAAETAGNGQLLSAGLTALGRPHVTITAGPGSFTQSHVVAFAFSGPAGAAFECRLDAADADPWTPCGVGPTGSYGAPNESEGVHVFEVRAVSPDPAIGAGPSVRRTFVVDGSAPHVSVDNPASDQVVNGNSLTLRFSSDDGAAAFACSLDGLAPTPCSDPKTYTGLLAGDHVFAVSATDAAGNASAPVTFRFTVVPAPAGTPGGGASSRTPVPSTLKPAGPAGAVARLSTALRPVSVRLMRHRATVRKLQRSRRIVVVVKTPSAARAVTLALWKGKDGTVPLAQASLRVAGGRTQHVELALSGRVAKRLGRGSYLVGVTLGDGASLYGPARFRRLAVVR